MAFAAALAFGALSCNDELDLKPQNEAEDKFALATDNNVKATLRGAYQELSLGDMLGGNILRNSELLGSDGDLSFFGTYNAPAEIWRKEMTTVNLDVSEFWLNAYSTINTVNNVLSALDIVNEEDRTLVEAEARFIRGLVYFELVRFFAQPYNAPNAPSSLGVPIILEPTKLYEDVEYPERSTVTAVYNQAISDLQFAEENLPASNGVYANKVAAATILSRIYLQQQDYEQALAAANRGLEYAQGTYFLVDDLTALYNQGNNTAEDVFAIQVNTQDGVNNMQLFFAETSVGGRGDIEIDEEFLSLYEEGDERLDLFYYDSEGLRSGKWYDQFANVKVIRLAELYLTRAEANAALGSSEGATPLDDINLIRERAELEPLSSVSLDGVRLERLRELAFEGFKVHDYKRWEANINGLPFDDNMLVFPIPQREINANPSLQGQQNPGYGN